MLSPDQYLIGALVAISEFVMAHCLLVSVGVVLLAVHATFSIARSMRR